MSIKKKISSTKTPAFMWKLGFLREAIYSPVKHMNNATKKVRFVH